MTVDLKKRSWVKCLSWGILGVIVLATVSYVFTRNVGATTGIALIFPAIRLVLYYFHERFWERISWGRLKHPLSHLPVRNDLTREDLEAIRSLLAEADYLAEAPEYQI